MVLIRYLSVCGHRHCVLQKHRQNIVYLPSCHFNPFKIILKIHFGIDSLIESIHVKTSACV